MYQYSWDFTSGNFSVVAGQVQKSYRVPSGKLTVTLWLFKIAMENHHVNHHPSINGPFSMAMLNNHIVDLPIYPLEMVIFHSYVSLPEGNCCVKAS